MELIFLISSTIIFFALAIGTYTDIKTREVPDWLNYSLIITGLTIWLLYSIISSQFNLFFNSLAGFALLFIFALIMFYTGQWGGGDSKMLMALGALIGFDISLKTFPFLISFLINILLIGAVYGFLWSLVLAIKNIKTFFKELKKLSQNKNIIKIKKILLVLIIIYIILFFIINDYFIKITTLFLILAIIFTFYLWIFVKVVEKTCMYKYIEPEKLTEGDWIAKPVKHKGKTICSPKDLGIEKKQIALLKRYKIKKVLIKEGIPFVPSFLIAFLISLYLLYYIPETAGNLIFLFI